PTGITASISARNCSRRITFPFWLQAIPANVRCSAILNLPTPRRSTYTPSTTSSDLRRASLVVPRDARGPLHVLTPPTLRVARTTSFGIGRGLGLALLHIGLADDHGLSHVRYGAAGLQVFVHLFAVDLRGAADRSSREHQSPSKHHDSDPHFGPPRGYPTRRVLTAGFERVVPSAPTMQSAGREALSPRGRRRPRRPHELERRGIRS